MKRLALLVMLLALGGFSVGCSPAADSGGAATGGAEAPAEGTDAAGAAGGGETEGEAAGSSETTH